MRVILRSISQRLSNFVELGDAEGRPDNWRFLCLPGGQICVQGVWVRVEVLRRICNNFLFWFRLSRDSFKLRSWLRLLDQMPLRHFWIVPCLYRFLNLLKISLALDHADKLARNQLYLEIALVSSAQRRGLHLPGALELSQSLQTLWTFLEPPNLSISPWLWYLRRWVGEPPFVFRWSVTRFGWLNSFLIWQK